MSKRILTTEPALKTVRDTGPSPRRVEPRDVAAAIGAEATGASLENALAPVTLFALREELLNRLQSAWQMPSSAETGKSIKDDAGEAKTLA